MANWPPLNHQDTTDKINAMVADLIALSGRVDAKGPLRLVVNTQTGTAYTLRLADEARVVEMDNTAANAVTVPANASVPIPIGAVIGVRQVGIGQTGVVPATGVTIRSRGNALKIAGQYGEGALVKRAADEWIFSGDITA